MTASRTSTIYIVDVSTTAADIVADRSSFAVSVGATGIVGIALLHRRGNGRVRFRVLWRCTIILIQEVGIVRIEPQHQLLELGKKSIFLMG